MSNPLADFLLRLEAGIPVGNALCQVPLGVSAQMTERQLELLADALSKKEGDVPPEDEPDPREYHREWAKLNKIPPWWEPIVWERKVAASGESTTECS